MRQPEQIYRGIDRTTGYELLVLRNSMGAFCGYVRVPEDHPWYMLNYHPRREPLSPIFDIDPTGINERIAEQQAEDEEKGVKFPDDYDTSPENLISVHGGVTFSGQPWATDGGWWFGFDCAHFNDWIPGVFTFTEREGLRIWKPDEVMDECRKMAKQLKEIAEVIPKCIPESKETDSGTS